MIVLGISAFYHDSAATLLEDDCLIAAAQEERFSRKKHDASFPVNAIKYCLEEAGISMNDVDAVAFYDKPILKFERLLETYYAFAPKGFRSFLMAIPVWLREKLFLKNLIRRSLKEIGYSKKNPIKLLFPEHHLSHAASAFYPSPFEEAAILTIDGVGEWATASLSKGKGHQIEILKELHFPHSIGLLYSSFTYFLGFKVNSGEYKLMGLAPYGNPNSEQTTRFIQIIKQHLVHIKEDGSIWLNQQFFSYATGLRMVPDKKWERLLGIPKRAAESDLNQDHCNLALAIQKVTEEIILKMAREVKKLTGARYLCMAGGAALNCVANGFIEREGLFDQVFIQPAAGDAGGSLGAAYSAYHIYFQKERKVQQGKDKMQAALLGPSFYKGDILKSLKKFKPPFEYFEKQEDLLKEVANLILDDKVIGWFQGRMEFGPRALGNRSIIANPKSITMQQTVNLKIKKRESFRPFAPAVLEEDVSEYFDFEGQSPYMMLVHPVHPHQLEPLPAGYVDLSIKEKLNTSRSKYQSITHVDLSARIQTVSKEQNPRFWALLTTLKKQCGTGMVINTSFNVRGEPIVCSPEDAYQCFMKTEMDVLVIENCLFYKKDQPVWKEV